MQQRCVHVYRHLGGQWLALPLPPPPPLPLPLPPPLPLLLLLLLPPLLLLLPPTPLSLLLSRLLLPPVAGSDFERSMLVINEQPGMASAVMTRKKMVP